MSFTARNDPQSRKKEYIETIHYYLNKFSIPIVFVENSGEDLSPFFTTEIEKQKLEVLTFVGNNYPREIGKGLGEMKCLEYGLNNSKLINNDSFIFKITGRYKILNLKKFIAFYENHPDMELMADLAENFTLSQSGIFGFKSFFAHKFLFQFTPIINDSKKMYFEHVLAKAVLTGINAGIKFYIFKYFPKLKAISGSTGKPHRKSFIFLFPRRIKYLIRYMIIMQ